MPSNVSTPIWACDVCGKRFGDRHDVAAACEASPVPDVVTVQLDARNDRFMLIRLTDPRLRTRTTEYNFNRPDTDRSGHYWSYKEEGDSGSYRTDGDNLVPGTAGYVQIRNRHNGALWVSGDTHAGTVNFESLAAAAGLDVKGVPLDDGYRSWSTQSWVGPITDEMRALYDAFDARLSLQDERWTAGRNPYRRHQLVSSWLDGARRSVLQAKADYRLRDHGQVVEAVFAAWEDWWAGADISVPAPPLTSPSSRTASTLTKPLRELIAATGVEWRPRTSASEFIRTATFTKLGVPMPSEKRLFDGLPIVAVGGVRGGVGKSQVSRWLAGALAKRGKRVLLLDLDLTAPAQHLAFGLTDGVRVDDERLRMLAEPVEGGFHVFSIGQFGPGAAFPDRWGEKDVAAFIEFVGATLDVSGFDRIVVDLPSGDGIERSILATRHKANLTDEVVVTTADPHALASARTAIRQALHENHRRILVENMSTATGPGPDGVAVTIRLRGDGTEVPALAAETRTAFAGSLPWSTDLTPPAEIDPLADLLVEEAS